jgi:hypothetical protein
MLYCRLLARIDPFLRISFLFEIPDVWLNLVPHEDQHCRVYRILRLCSRSDQQRNNRMVEEDENDTPLGNAFSYCYRDDPFQSGCPKRCASHASSIRCAQSIIAEPNLETRGCFEVAEGTTVGVVERHSTTCICYCRQYLPCTTGSDKNVLCYYCRQHFNLSRVESATPARLHDAPFPPRSPLGAVIYTAHIRVQVCLRKPSNCPPMLRHPRQPSKPLASSVQLDSVEFLRSVDFSSIPTRKLMAARRSRI